MAKDYYSILGLEPGASQDEIIEAFYRLSQKHFPQTESSATARVQMHEISEAWQVLSDRRQREAYDAQLRQRRYGIFSRLVRVPRRAKSELKQSLRMTRREVDKGRGNLVLLALTAILLVLIYGVGPQDRQQVQAKADDAMAIRLSGMEIQPQEILGPFYPTFTPSPLKPTRTPTRKVTEQAVWSEAAVRATVPVPTATPTRTRQPATQVAVVATTVRVRLTATATATATETGYKYPEPHLIAPEDGSRYLCGHALVLVWSMDKATEMGQDEWFLVEARGIESEAWNGLADWTREQTVSLNPNKRGKNCDIPGLPVGTFEWRVRIVQGDRNTHSIQRFLSLPSAPLFINHDN